jgi:hypothetical protein
MTCDELKIKIDILYPKYKNQWMAEIIDDVDLNEATLDKKALSTEKTKQKWAKRFLVVSRLANMIEREKDKIISELNDYYLFDSEIKYKQTEANIKIKGNQRYLDIFKVRDDCDEILKFLEYNLKMVESLQWDIKNYIEYKKLLML